MNKQLFSNVNDTDFQVFYGFSNAEDVFSTFEVGDANIEGIEFIFAEYAGGSYEGEALVIYTQDGKLYEVNGSHCSCYGLEGQWKPEETLAIALMSRPNVPDTAKANLRQFYKNFMSFL